MTDISILDQSPLDDGQTVRAAIERSVKLAQLADQLKYKRYFVAEHHNMPEVAGTSPEILVTHILNQTTTIRVGSGGVMLQHYSPFKVIEQFHFISNLAPGRVDLGIGKAPGGFPLATKALQADLNENASSFEEKFHLLNQFNQQSFPQNSEFAQLTTAIRNEEVTKPEVFLLGTSINSAELAAKERVGFIYAYFINSNDKALKEAVQSYKAIYPEGRMIVAVAAVVAENLEQLEKVEAGRTNYALHFEDGRKITVNNQSQVDLFRQQSTEKFEIEEKRIDVFTGQAHQIKDAIAKLNVDGDIDEFMLHMPVHDAQLRKQTVIQLAPVNSEQLEKEGII